jgi:membrane protease subunit HflK
MINNQKRKILIGIAAIVLIYLATGIFSLQSGQHALILRFGKIVKEVTQSGINYHLPYLIETALKVHVNKVQKVVIQEQKGDHLEELTGDENLLIVDATISYDVKNLTQYLFNQTDVKSIVANAGQRCLSQELAQMMVDDVMTTGKLVLKLVMKEKLQQTLDELQTGVRIISLELTNISPPSSVSMAFKAVSDAREKKQRIIKEAEGYANSTLPEARGKASGVISESETYANEIQKRAQAKTKAFDAMLTEYQRNPNITSRLMYLETLKTVFQRCTMKVDANPKESIYYIGKGGNLKQ